MVAYSFKKQFVEPIRAGTKRQTIRAHRRRHARPGEPIQLYCGMRTKHCFKIIDDPICEGVESIKIMVGARNLWITREGKELDVYGIEALSRDDGFPCVERMHKFWLDNHGRGVFEGVIIKW